MEGDAAPSGGGGGDLGAGLSGGGDTAATPRAGDHEGGAARGGCGDISAAPWAECPEGGASSGQIDGDGGGARCGTSQPASAAGPAPSGASAAAAPSAAIGEAMQKVVQLTKAAVFLHTRSDGHEARCASLREAHEEELKRVELVAAAHVGAQEAQAAAAASWREARRSGLGRAHAAAEERARREVQGLRARGEALEQAERARLAREDEAHAAAAADARRQAERLLHALGAAEVSARSDRQWVARQIAGQAARTRRAMDREFEEACARLRSEHTAEAEALRAARDEAVCEQRALLEAARAEAGAQAGEQLAAAVALQEAELQQERCGLEARAEAAGQALALARAEAGAARAECAECQRALDGMSRELQERRRRGHALAAEADQAHHRKLKAEAQIRELRRQRAAVERVIGSAGSVPRTERAVASISEDVKAAQSNLEELRGKLARAERLKQERRTAASSCEALAERLERELREERGRSDELQRMLLRLEHNS
ncbi:unnamed protein product [Prorocentrum cordatum]|uniref:Protein FAM184A/B N-terminal domain-containing protein n=1 Tax=Prorocentrum cordatum TaxID=2364126 RepID=A0ABN9UA97_9DINO|nr:unnamed protein product [Polarella glacialis]